MLRSIDLTKYFDKNGRFRGGRNRARLSDLEFFPLQRYCGFLLSFVLWTFSFNYRDRDLIELEDGIDTCDDYVDMPLAETLREH